MVMVGRSYLPFIVAWVVQKTKSLNQVVWNLCSFLFFFITITPKDIDLS